ncbi:MAG: glutaminyl-peptide cyclotransferase [Rhodanobacter sp.]|nr:MAG: glutaminyl-peptide cyclotransferase [Rhodanobacter sp.]TAM15125.1 MAG: glutaminyl-peptide cyclotransferase [Rhodanobacter sp.]TAM36405.1 MAG: glutaminyl-peptide cyclotransferase [Rhodanobacter sp.]
MKTFAALFAFVLFAPLAPVAAHAAIPVYGYHVVHRYPHDVKAYTEGLLYRDGFLYESTGQVGSSGVRKVELATGKVLQSAPTPWPDYGEGIANWKDRLIQLTWKNQEGFLYHLATLEPYAKFGYPGEGWALTSDGQRLYMSDGTPTIRILDPETLRQTGSIAVTVAGEPLRNINELEWVKGEIWANVWLTTRIARIDPASGKVVGWIELAGLVPPASTLADPLNNVLNGIAYDAKHDRIFVTGKCWPWLYEIRLTAPARNH